MTAECFQSDKLVDENLIYGYFSQYGTVADVSIKGAFVKPVSFLIICTECEPSDLQCFVSVVDKRALVL